MTQFYTQAKIINRLVTLFGFQSIDELQSYLDQNKEALDTYQSNIIDGLTKDFDLEDIDFIFPPKPVKKIVTKPADPVDPNAATDPVNS